MLFNSFEFALFFLAVIVVVFVLQERNVYKKAFLVLASLFFYMYWKVNYVWLLAGSILFNYAMARLIGSAQDPRLRKRLVFFAVAGNLALLSIYKYTNFIINNINSVLSFLGAGPIPATNIILPIGISFFTFQAICYIVDVYRKKIGPAGIINTSLYISFFPHLIAGPIIRADNIIPQFDAVKVLRKDNLALGLHRVFWGLIKKMVIADNLALFVNQVFGQYQQYNWLTLLISVYAFAFQIYGDFSGYSDIAIGCFKILGYEIPENFNLPYAAAGFSDFWKRWHISLSSWLRDYLYIPLGGNMLGPGRTYLNLMITMFLGGLWHGAKWTFVVWGALHGLYLIIEKILAGRFVMPEPRLSKFVRMFVTFQLICFAWIFFRAESFRSGLDIATSIFTLRGGEVLLTFNTVFILASFFALHILKARFPVYDIFRALPYYARYFAYAVGIFLLFFNKASISSQFIYFQF